MIDRVGHAARIQWPGAVVVTFFICGLLSACDVASEPSADASSGAESRVAGDVAAAAGNAVAADQSVPRGVTTAAMTDEKAGKGRADSKPAADQGSASETGAQENKNKNPAVRQEAQAPESKSPQTDQVGPTQPRQPAPIVTTPIADIQDYRGDAVLNVPTDDERVALEVSDVDYEASVIAKVGGRPLTRGEFRKRATLLLGGAEIDQYITFVLTKNRLDQLVAAGADPSLYTVSDQEVLRSIDEKKKIAPQVMRRSGEEWEKLIREQFGWERFLEVEKANLSFSKVFLPPILSKEDREKGTGKGVTELPEYTAELLEPAMADTLKRYYKEGTEIPFLFQSTFVQQIRTALLKSCHITYWFEREIDPNWLFVLEKQSPAADEAAPDAPGAERSFEPVSAKADEIWALLQPRIKPGDLELALRDAVVGMAVDQALDRQGFLLSADEREAAFKKHQAVYEGTLFPLQLVASLKGFGSLHKYREYYGRKAGFEQYLRMQYPGAAWDKAIEAHYSSGPSRLFFRNGRVMTEVIWVAAWDAAANAPKEGGLEAAVQKAANLADRARKGEKFLALLNEASELPDSDKIHRGRYGVKSRYELRQALGETEYSIFASGGYCLADELFYRAVEGAIIGPVVRSFPERGKGAFVVRVDHFEQNDSGRGFEEQKELVQSDFIDLRYQMFVFDCLKTAQVELTHRGSDR